MSRWRSDSSASPRSICKQGRYIPGRLFGLDRINKANFAEMLPHLEGYPRNTILDGCG